ncbi:MAG: peptidylprolyl isomerase [bacterium]|nr:peptidylprolyl isomerase [bacterium]
MKAPMVVFGVDINKRLSRDVSAIALLCLTLVTAGVFYVANRAGAIADALVKNHYVLSTNSDFKEVKKMKIEDVTVADIVTTSGTISVEFLRDKAPKTVENFIKLAREGFYDGTKFHRVIPDFMIQGGDPLSKDDNKKILWGTGGPGYTFPDEINDVKIVRGTVAMANSGPDTNGSQFFIVTTAQTPWLDGKHTVFGKVTSNMDVANNISMSPKGPTDIPLSPIVIEKIILK